MAYSASPVYLLKAQTPNSAIQRAEMRQQVINGINSIEPMLRHAIGDKRPKFQIQYVI